MKLQRHFVMKPWGRDDIAARFAAPPGQRIGEVWYEGAPPSFGLLAKYLFTSEKLSIQVHPDDAQAAARGHPMGKSEFWFVTDAKPGATIGIGTTAPLSASALREAALSGAIEDMIDWRPAKAGDFYYVPPRTIHAIGPGVTLIEIQRAVDITYRLYDYGRPRELHIDEGVMVACAQPHPPELSGRFSPNVHAAAIEGPPFTVRFCSGDLIGVPAETPLLMVPLNGTVSEGDESATAGDCLYCSDRETVVAQDGARMIVAWPVSVPVDGILSDAA